MKLLAEKMNQQVKEKGEFGIDHQVRKTKIVSHQHNYSKYCEANGLHHKNKLSTISWLLLNKRKKEEKRTKKLLLCNLKEQ